MPFKINTNIYKFIVIIVYFSLSQNVLLFYLHYNRLLYSVMYNMERYCTSLYCIENPYWTRLVLKTCIGRGVSSNTGFQYNTDEYNIFPYCT